MAFGIRKMRIRYDTDPLIMLIKHLPGFVFQNRSLQMSRQILVRVQPPVRCAIVVGCHFSKVFRIRK